MGQTRATADALGLGWRFSHLRTAGGDHEIDLIADLPGGDVLAFEAKLSQTVTAADTRHLVTLKKQLGASFRAGLIVHPGETACRLDDRIAAVPLAVLVSQPGLTAPPVQISCRRFVVIPHPATPREPVMQR